MKNVVGVAVVAALIATSAASAGAPRRHPAGYWNKNVCKPMYLRANMWHPASANETCTKLVTLHVYVNGHSQILTAEQFHNTATFYGNQSVVRIYSHRGQQYVSAVTTSTRTSRIRVRFTPDWQLG